MHVHTDEYNQHIIFVSIYVGTVAILEKQIVAISIGALPTSAVHITNISAVIVSYEYLRQNKHRFITGLMVYVIKTYFSITKSLSKPIYNPGVDEIFER